jgi:hypothetical protein
VSSIIKSSARNPAVQGGEDVNSVVLAPKQVFQKSCDIPSISFIDLQRKHPTAIVLGSTDANSVSVVDASMVFGG